MTKNIQTTDRRQAAAIALVEAHLANRDAKLITARVNASGVNTWTVNGHVVTLAPFVTCDCGDFAHRKPAAGCKHIQAILHLTAPIEAAPAAEWAPVTGWLSDNRRKAGRRELVEEAI